MPEERPAVTYGELFKAAKEVVRRLIADVGTNGGRWHDLIERLAGIPRDEFQAIVGHLLTLGLQAFSPADRLKVWDSLRGVISRHLEFPDAEWALRRAQVEQLQQIYTRLEPADPVVQRSWLFAHTPVFPHAGYTEWRERQEAIARARVQAVRELFALGGLPMVLELARQVEQPWSVGMAFGKCDILLDEEDRLLRDILGSSDVSQRDLALGFLHGRAAVRGQTWLDSIQGRKIVETWTPHQRADLYRCLPFCASTWDALEATDAEMQHLYWREVAIYGHGDMPTEGCERAVMKFVEYGRLGSAVKFLSLHSRMDDAASGPNASLMYWSMWFKERLQKRSTGGH
jgi:hypothetical protein